MKKYLSHTWQSGFLRTRLCLMLGPIEEITPLALLRHFGSEARIFAFEPGGHAYKLLDEMVSHVPNVRLERIGFGDRTEIVNLYADAQGSELASLYPRRVFEDDGSSGPSAEKVKIMRIDEYCRMNGIGRINLLKVDVEGHEISVLKGCGDLLSRKNIDVIQFEFGASHFELANLSERSSLIC